MATELLKSISLAGPLNVSLLRLRFVTTDASQVMGYTAAGGRPNGVLRENSPAVNPPLVDANTATEVRNVALLTEGSRQEIEAGGAIAVNDQITSDSNGKAVVAGSGDIVYGRALIAASADGDIIDFRVEAILPTLP